MKKALAILLSLMLLIGLVPAAVADSGTLTTYYSGEVSTLNYLVSSTENDQVVGANIVDTLVEYNTLGEVIPCLAETWESSEDGLTWTFHLRKGVKWYNCFGEEVAELTAADFVAGLKYVLTAKYESAIASNVFTAQIVNAEAYYNGEVTDFDQVGVKAMDDYTLQYNLANPVPYFVSMTTYGSFMPVYGPLAEEQGANLGVDNQSIYYCGAYILETFEPQSERLYVKNQNYWDADNVFIEKIDQLYNAEAATLSPIAALRGEVDYADLDNDILDDWRTNHPELITQARSNLQYSYFYCFDFAPQYEEEYDPANWVIAVNNSNFRHSIMSAMDRLYGMTAEADNPENLLENTITPPAFASVNGKDFTALPAFANIDQYFYNTEKALEYKAKAVEELTAAGATFPVKLVLTYKSNDSDWANEVQLEKAQLESVLGTDYIEVILYAGPADNFLSQTRRAGKYSMQKCNWGADYADPETWTDPFAENIDSETGLHKGNSYNFIDKMLDTDNEETKAFLTAYYAKVAEAKAETNDIEKRYNLFAEAEAMLIENAIVIPFRKSIAGYQVTKIDVYEGEYAPFGICNLKYKFQHLQDEFVTAEQNEQSYQKWLEAKTK